MYKTIEEVAEKLRKWDVKVVTKQEFWELLCSKGWYNSKTYGKETPLYVDEVGANEETRTRYVLKND